MDAANLRQIHALAHAGLPTLVATGFMSAFEPPLAAEANAFLFGPLVVQESPWNEGRPEWLARHARIERLGIVYGVTPQWIIGPCELAAVLYGASFDAPLRHEYAELYVWATATADATRKGLDPITHAAALGVEAMREEQIVRGNGQVAHAYRGLASDVRRRVTDLGAARVRQEKKQEKPAKACYNEKPKKGKAAQPVYDQLIF